MKNKFVITIASLSLAILLLLGFVLNRTAFRKTVHIISVDTNLYSQMEASGKKWPDSENYIFVPLEKAGEYKTTFWGKIYSTSAYLYLDKNLPLLQENSCADIEWIIQEDSLVPVIDAPFEAKNPPSVLDPKLSLGFSSVEQVPQSKRALPVDGIYAGGEGYSLNVNTKAALVVYEKNLKDEIIALLNPMFNKDSADQSGVERETVFIASVGDIMVARGTQDILLGEPKDGKSGIERVFTTTLPLLQGSDFTIGNLEGVITTSNSNATKTYTFKFDKRVLGSLKEAGFDYLMQTNNHCYDYGEPGFKDTLKALEEYDIPSSGIGYNYEEARKFYHTEVKGQKLAVISCGAYPVERSGFNGKKTATATETRAGILWENEQLLEDIKAEKEQGYFVIVNVHGGQEYVFTPSASQRELYQKFCDAGADVVFGSHPHVLQNTEWYKNSLIVYSMGNFVFKGMEGMFGAQESEVVRVGINNGKIVYVEQFPAKLDGNIVGLK